MNRADRADRTLQVNGEHLYGDTLDQIRYLAGAVRRCERAAQDAEHKAAALERDLLAVEQERDQLRAVLTETTKTLENERCEHSREVKRLADELARKE